MGTPSSGKRRPPSRVRLRQCRFAPFPRRSGSWLIRRTINGVLPATELGGYPEPRGWLHVVDVVFGLALVAYSEEVVFRRCARHLFQIYLNDGYALVVVTSLLFGAYHWWTGFGNIVEAVLIGILLMLFYVDQQRFGRLCLDTI
jgi:membrane protease YdiL (CAAX protease family)